VAYNAEVLWFYPVQVKKALTGSGKATKEEMQAAAERVGGFTKGLTADEADGWGVTLAGWHKLEGVEL